MLKSSISAFTAFCRFLCILTGLDHVIIIHELGSSVKTISSNKKCVSILLARSLSHHHFFCILTSLDHVIIIHELGSSVKTISSNKKCVSILLARSLSHHHFFSLFTILVNLLLRIIFHATCSFVLFDCLIHVHHHHLLLRRNYDMLVICCSHLIIHCLLANLLWTFLARSSQIVLLVLLRHLNHSIYAIIVKSVRLWTNETFWTYC